MSRYLDAQLVPVAVALDDRLGLTLWAPHWRDDDGDEVQGFLGAGGKVLVFAAADDLARYLSDHPHDDLSEHPGWPAIVRTPAAQLRAEHGDLVDFDEVFPLLSSEPTPQACRAVSKAVQLAEAIAESCGDTELLEVLERPAYQLALGGENSLLAGRFGSSNWQSVGAEAAGSWQWIAERLRQHISWVGDASVRDAGAVLQSNPAPAPWVADSYGYRQAFPGGVPDEALPSRTPTVLITLFFGLFGIIPAAVATSQARASRVNTGRYWAAFGWTLVLSVVVWFVFVMLVAGLALSAGSG